MSQFNPLLMAGNQPGQYISNQEARLRELQAEVMFWHGRIVAARESLEKTYQYYITWDSTVAKHIKVVLDALEGK